MKHQKIFSEFTVPRPIITNHLLFGRANLAIDCQFPSRKKFNELMKLSQHPRLIEIKYKCAVGAYGLTHIQLIYDNGMSSPVYEDANYKDDTSEWNTTSIDMSRVIRRVGFKIS